ncbi:helicase associated domain-containing protein [Streptomyces sp. NPDC056237]|uniref:helicase associated domain-containing protein n=1 Tax=unclassified Streptomyces TaxID=2593676 RepID=UPI0035DE5F42
MWELNLRAAQQYHAWEGHLRAPRKHVEHLAGAAESTAGPSDHQAGADGVMVVKLGTWLDNVRKRAGKLTEQRRADLDRLGMRWSEAGAAEERAGADMWLPAPSPVQRRRVPRPP